MLFESLCSISEQGINIKQVIYIDNIIDKIFTIQRSLQLKTIEE